MSRSQPTLNRVLGLTTTIAVAVIVGFLLALLWGGAEGSTVLRAIATAVLLWVVSAVAAAAVLAPRKEADQP